MGDDGFAVADGLAVIDDIGQLPARRGGSVENMLMDERRPRELEEGKYLQPVAVVVGDAEQFRIGIERQHRLCTRMSFGAKSRASMPGYRGLINGSPPAAGPRRPRRRPPPPRAPAT